VADLDRLVDGMHRVVVGEVAIDSYLIERLLRPAHRRSDRLADPHERRVLALQALGCQVVTYKLGLPGSGDPGRAGVNVRVFSGISSRSAASLFDCSNPAGTTVWSR
jgi:hypothetical protein